jgi:AcrR family transcriptional regulator
MKGSDDHGKREKKRKMIMKAALKIFSQKGYSPAALDEVAREASIAKGTLYLYFQDKEDLFSSTILYVMENLAARIVDSISDTMSPVEILRSIAYTELDYFASNMEFFGLIHTAMSGNLLGNHETLLKTLNERRMTLVEYLKGVVQEAKRRDQVRKDIETEQIVYSYLGMIESAIDQMHLKQDVCSKNRSLEERGSQGKPSLDIEKKVDTIILILLEGIRGNANEK